MATVFAAQCRDCNFSQRIIGHSDYAYRLIETPDVFMWVQFAWCDTCQQVVQAEKLVSEAQSEEWINDCTSIRVRRDAMRYQRMIEKRHSPARCLRCGGIEIVAATGNWHERFLVHSICGGIISLTRSGHARLGQTEVYSSEGEHLTTVDGILLPGRGY